MRNYTTMLKERVSKNKIFETVKEEFTYYYKEYYRGAPIETAEQADRLYYEFAYESIQLEAIAYNTADAYLIYNDDIENYLSGRLQEAIDSPYSPRIIEEARELAIALMVSDFMDIALDFSGADLLNIAA